MYSDPVHGKLLKVMPGLIDQNCGCIHLAKYCVAARDGNLLTGMLKTAELLLTNTLHIEPYSGHVKLAFLYIVTGYFVQAIDTLNIAENNFLYTIKNMVHSAVINFGLKVDINVVIPEVFRNWAEGQVTCNIQMAWQEYNAAPDLLQF